jgi:hypothetical protein
MSSDSDQPGPIPYATPDPRRQQWVRPFVAGVACAAVVVGVLGLFIARRVPPLMTAVPTTTPMLPAVPPPPPVPAVMSLASTSDRFTIRQRRFGTLPGSSDTIVLMTDDVTGGQVQVDVRTSDGRHLAGASLRRGGALPFTLDGAGFVVVLVELHNQLVGQDHAEFVVRPASAAPTAEERIARLVDATRESGGTVEWPDATGDEPAPRHDRADEPRPVAQYLLEVWGRRSVAIRTPADLVREAGRPVSRTSGEPQVRLPGGARAPLAEWLAKHAGP